MATIYAPDANNKLLHTGESGNTVTYVYSNASAANSADVIRMGKIPAGTRVTDVRIKAADTGTGNTLDVGYAPVGSSPTATPAYWWDNLDTATAAVDARSTASPIKFERDVWLEILVNSANFTGTPLIEVVVYGVNEGVK